MSHRKGSAYAGKRRPGNGRIGKKRTRAARAHIVAGSMEELCDWIQRPVVESISDYALRLRNVAAHWVHPFDDSKGRTSRAVAYLVLCATVGHRFSGRMTIPEIIAANKPPCYDALERIDKSDRIGEPDLTPMKDFIAGCLAKQLAGTFEAATKLPTRDACAERKFH